MAIGMAAACLSDEMKIKAPRCFVWADLRDR